MEMDSIVYVCMYGKRMVREEENEKEEEKFTETNYYNNIIITDFKVYISLYTFFVFFHLSLSTPTAHTF